MEKILIAITDKDKAIETNNYLEDHNYAPYIVTDSSGLMGKINSNEFSIILLDLLIIEESELDIISFIKKRDPGLNVIIISCRDNLDKAIDIAERNGFSYMAKPINFNELKYLIRRSKKEGREGVKKTGYKKYFRGKFVGKSDAIKGVINRAAKVAVSESNILITGETGTGKELVARGIYEMSNRSGAAFVALNCAAIPDNLLESELFGYKKGAFTGAVSDKKGVVEMADKGTLFLDEIGDLSLNLQSKLLRVLEYRELRRLGDNSVRKVDIRIIAATNQDLTALIKEKKFREDLFFRLNVIHIHIPSLRERKDDVPVLLRFFVEKYNNESGRDIMGIDPKAKAILMQYDYPGNVRELENIVQHAFALAETDIIKVEDLPVNLHNISPYPRLEAYKKEEQNGVGGEGEELLLSEVEKNTIKKALEKYPGSYAKAAKALGISRSTLWRKIKDYGIKQ